MLINVLTVLAFLAIVAAVLVIRALVLSWQGTFAAQATVDDGRGYAPTDPVFGDFTDPLAAQLPLLGSTEDSLEHDLRRAGYYKPTARNEFLALRNIMAIGVIIFVGVTAVMVGPERRDLLAKILIWGFAAAALAYILPWLFLRSKVRRRTALIQRGLPDAFDMLTMCLSGGLGVNDSLAHVSREIYSAHPDLGVELEIVRRHAEMSSLGDAFRQFAARIDIPETAALKALMQQTERLGTNVVQAVKDFADDIRTRQRQTADERASKAGIKLLFPLVFCLAPAAMIILWGPALLELRNFFRTFNPGG
ncbi:MAG: type II secretion system F family protein [Planctomycetaceae bacterium]|nr:type II secretion system F family protein [Planctomycetaceae bacterium]